MKLFDARWKGAHGIGRFATELHRRLSGFRDVSLHGSPAAPLDPIRLSLHLRAAAPRLYFSPGYNAPLWAPCPFVFCLHDLNHLHVIANSSPLKRAYYEFVVRPAVHRAELVFTVSEFSRSAICEWSGVDASKIVNVGNGVSSAFGPDGAISTLIDRPYFLYVGSHKPHKNLARLVRGFAASAVARELILVATGTPAPDLSRLISSMRLADRVRFFGRPTEQELAQLYRGATAVVLLSTYEGFGLPIIEAMACGTPVVTSAVTSMPEIAGDAALLVDPYDVEAISAALARIVTDSTLRGDLRRRGLARAARFSWDETARRVTSALRSRFPGEITTLGMRP